MRDALGTTGQLKDPEGSIDMFELLAYERFRDTPSVRFFDVTVDTSNARDLVIHSGPVISKSCFNRRSKYGEIKSFNATAHLYAVVAA